jgi:hypothetical protein
MFLIHICISVEKKTLCPGNHHISRNIETIYLKITMSLPFHFNVLSSVVGRLIVILFQAFCPVANIIPAVDKKGITRSYMMNDSVCCEVIEKIPDSDKMVCCMKGTPRKPNEPERRPPLGLISADDFPLVYK